MQSKKFSINKILCFITVFSLIISSFSFINAHNTNKKLNNLYALQSEDDSSGVYFLNERDINTISSKVESELTSLFQKEFDKKALSLSEENSKLVSSIGEDIQSKLADLAVTTNYITKADLDSIIQGIVGTITVDYQLSDEKKAEIEKIASSASKSSLVELKSTVSELANTVNEINNKTKSNSNNISSLKSDTEAALSLSSTNKTDIQSLKAAVSELQSETLNNLNNIQSSVKTLEAVDLTTKEGITNAVTSINALKADLETSSQTITEQTSSSINELISNLEANFALLNEAIKTNNGTLTDKIISLSDTIAAQIVLIETTQATNLTTLSRELQSQISSLDLSQSNNVKNISTKISELENEIRNLYSNDEISNQNYESLQNSLKELQKYTNGELYNLSVSIEECYTLINETESKLNEQIQNASTSLAASILDLDNRMTTLESTIVSTMCDKLYPVGSIYTSVSDTNPSELFGGTWIPWGSGRVPVGVDETQESFNVVEKTGGSDETLLTIANLPSHSHTYNWSGTPTGTVLSNTTIADAGNHSHTFSWYGTTSASASTSVTVNTTSDLNAQIGNMAAEKAAGLNVSGKATVTKSAEHGLKANGTWYDDLLDQVYLNFNHNHTATAYTSVSINPFTVSGTTSNSGTHSHSASTTSSFKGNELTVSGNTSSIGQSKAIDNKQSYITCYMWKRIS